MSKNKNKKEKENKCIYDSEVIVTVNKILNNIEKQYIRYKIINDFIVSKEKVILFNNAKYLCKIQIKSITKTEESFPDIEDEIEMLKWTKVRNISDILYESTDNSISYTVNDVKGLSRQYNRVKIEIENSLFKREIFSTYKIRPPTGLLLYGPPGTGKTLLISNIHQELKSLYHNLNFLPIACKDLISDSRSAESKLKYLFSKAKYENNGPTLIFIDEIDTIASKREEFNENKLLNILLTEIDGYSGDNKVNPIYMIAATNIRDSIDAALRRTGRLDIEIEIPVPNIDARFDILHTLLTNIKHDLSDNDIRDVSYSLNGYVGSDVNTLVRQSIFYANENSRGLSINDIQKAMNQVKPSCLRDFEIEIPKVKFSDIFGYEKAKKTLFDSIILPFERPDLFKKFKLKPPKGILMYGPPGCSKTMMAKACAHEAKMSFIAVQGPELLSKYVGDSEKAIRNVFEKARQAAPSIIFFDEIDSIGASRGSSTNSASDRVLCQVLTEMDGVRGLDQVLVIGATNRVDILDKALLRPGRFDRIIQIELPDEETRRLMIQSELSSMDLKKENENYQDLLNKMDKMEIKEDEKSFDPEDWDSEDGPVTQNIGPKVCIKESLAEQFNEYYLELWQIMNNDEDIENVKKYIEDYLVIVTSEKSGADILQLFNSIKISAIRRGNDYVDIKDITFGVEQLVERYQ